MKKLAVFLLLILVLTGCTAQKQPAPSSPRVVTGIEASFESNTLHLQRFYSSSEKLQAVLTYLRCLKTYGPPKPDIPIPQTNLGQIVISFSDGSTKTYEQCGDQFLRQDGGPWQYIDPEQGLEFSLLLGLMESDEIS